MPDVACEQCGQPVLDTANQCPHCGRFQPEAMFAMGVAHRACPACQVKNYIYRQACRHCRAPLLAPVSAMQIYEDRLLMLGQIHGRSKQAATFGALGFVLAGFVTGQIQRHDHGDSMDMLAITMAVAFVGGLLGWAAGFAAWTGYHCFKPWKRPGPR